MRELCIWARLQHENILPLIGMAVIDGAPVLASEWMENGTMNEYLRNQEKVDILAMVRARTIFRALKYSALLLRFKESRVVLNIFTTLVLCMLI